MIRSSLEVGRLLFQDPAGFRIIHHVKKNNATYLNYRELIDLRKVIHSQESRGINGVFVEAGCALGGSALVIAASKQRSRHLLVFDTFGAIPPPTEQDGIAAKVRYDTISSGVSPGIKKDIYYGYQGDLVPKVTQLFQGFGYPLDEYNTHLIKGNFNDTMTFIDPISFAHIDCDWYASIKVCLERIVPKMVTGSIIVIDDYGYYDGCTQAINEYFENKRMEYSFIFREQLCIEKQ